MARWQHILKELKRGQSNLNDENLEFLARMMALIATGPRHPHYRPVMKLIEESRPEYERR